MDRTTRRSTAALAAGVALLVAAWLAGSAPAGTAKAGAASQTTKKGGTFVVELSTDIDYIDPQLDYLSSGWELQYAVACKLFNYPDKDGASGSQLVPEVAQGQPIVSKDGRTYTFKLRNTFRFADGSRVTAKSFADAINRVAQPSLQSPASSFIDIIQGADAVLAGRAKTVSGVTASGSTLTIKLTKPAPDLLPRLAMPFFQAITPSLAANSDPAGVDTFSGCGPYTVVSRTPNRSILLKRNPYYKGSRPANVDAIDVRIGNSLQVIEQDVESGQTDYAAQGLDPASWKKLSDKYGVNKGRVFIRPSLSVQYLAMNFDRPLLKNNLALRKAVNQAIDRRALLAQSGFGAGVRADHILPPGVPGAAELPNGSLYPLKAPNLKKAKELAQDHLGDGKAVLWTSNRGAAPLQAQIYQYNLKQIGLDVDIQLLARAVQITREGVRGADFDFTTESWFAMVASAKAEAALQSLSGNFAQWLNDEVVNTSALANVFMTLADNKVTLVSIRSVGQQTEQAFLDLVEKEESRGFSRVYQSEAA